MDFADESATLAVPVSRPAPPPLAIRVGDQRYTIDPADGPVTIGREFPAQVLIHNPRISRNHLRIEAQADRWTAVDHSLTGTFVDGVRQGFLVIADGTTMQLGNPDGVPVSFAYATCTEASATPTYAVENCHGHDGDHLDDPDDGGGDYDDDYDDDSDDDSDDDHVEETPAGERTDPGLLRAGSAVAARRRELSLSQRTLARAKIMNAGALISFEKGRSWPRRSTQRKLEKFLEWQPGTIRRLREEDSGAPEPDGPTEILTNTVEASLMAEAVELALDSIKNTVDALPDPTDDAFSGQIGSVLADLRRLERLAGDAARSATGASDVVMVLSRARKMYRDLMLRAARSPQATPGQKLFAARHRADLTLEEAANGAGVPVEVITAAEEDHVVDANATPALHTLLDSLTRR